MHRRSLLKGIAAAALPALPSPAIAQPVPTLRFVPEANLTTLDPVWTTATVTTNHAYCVYDQLFAFDAAFRPRPQMAEGHEVSPDGRAWTIRLRDGLKFHDGTPVRSIDCAASIERWSRRDVFGQLMAKAVDKYETPDDRTLVIRLTRPFPLMLDALAKPDTSGLFIMPERNARTDPFKAITDPTGSGPYRFVREEWVDGSRIVYAKFDGYVPRQEPPEWGSGGKVAHFPRVEWQIMSDPSTVGAALQRGEIDWWAQPLPDLYGTLTKAGVNLQIDQPAGRLAMARMNCLQPPFNNAAVRRAVLMAVSQKDFLTAYTGDDPEMYHQCLSLFPCGTPYADETLGRKMMRGDLAEARKMLKDAGYNGEKTVVISASDLPVITAFGQVAHGLLRDLGMNVELAVSDWGSVVQRRASREPVDKGGWSMFVTAGPAVGYANPTISALVRGLGADGWFGWWKSPEAEAKVEAFLNAPDAASQKRIAVELNDIALADVATVPLGQYFVKRAYTRRITGVLQGISSYPWNVRLA
jgi:peptide/nickel transport system substrate-binding protein